MIQLHDKKFEVFISGEEINFAIENMVKQIEDDFCDDVPVFIGVLNGSFMVVADLLKKYSHNCEVSFVKMASYEGTQTTNEVKQLIGVNQNLEGRSVIIVEDIVDTGNTIEELKAITTRLGENSKMVLMGDATQSDIDNGSNIINNLKHNWTLGISELKRTVEKGSSVYGSDPNALARNGYDNIYSLNRNISPSTSDTTCKITLS